MPFSIRCPVCRKKFGWKPSAGFPDFCPNKECSSRISVDRDDDDIVMPFLRTSGKTAATDKVYRDMERGSEVRAQAAAEMTGASAAEMSGMKITDLNPTKNHGDVAAKWDHAAAARLGVQNQASLFKGSNGSEFAGAVQTGPHPNAGAHMRTSLQNYHADLTRGAAVSDRPATEVLQPGYRIRG